MLHKILSLSLSCFPLLIMTFYTWHRKELGSPDSVLVLFHCFPAFWQLPGNSNLTLRSRWWAPLAACWLFASHGNYSTHMAWLTTSRAGREMTKGKALQELASHSRCSPRGQAWCSFLIPSPPPSHQRTPNAPCCSLTACRQCDVTCWLNL